MFSQALTRACSAMCMVGRDENVVSKNWMSRPALVSVNQNSTCVIRYHGCTVTSALVQKLKTMADSVRVAQGLVDMPPNKVDDYGDQGFRCVHCDRQPWRVTNGD